MFLVDRVSIVTSAVPSTLTGLWLLPPPNSQAPGPQCSPTQTAPWPLPAVTSALPDSELLGAGVHPVPLVPAAICWAEGKFPPKHLQLVSRAGHSVTA